MAGRLLCSCRARVPGHCPQDPEMVLDPEPQLVGNEWELPRAGTRVYRQTISQPQLWRSGRPCVNSFRAHEDSQ